MMVLSFHPFTFWPFPLARPLLLAFLSKGSKATMNNVHRGSSIRRPNEYPGFTGPHLIFTMGVGSGAAGAAWAAP